jgi:hypothetical protein
MNSVAILGQPSIPGTVLERILQLVSTWQTPEIAGRLKVGGILKWARDQEGERWPRTQGEKLRFKIGCN